MTDTFDVAVIGAGPAGLMAAEVVARGGRRVVVVEGQPSPGRKFLLAGRGGLNLTHDEPTHAMAARYGPAAAFMAPLLDAFSGTDLRAWADALGAETFVGSSRRVFPKAMKASGLLRAWLRRLDAQGVRLLARTHWTGFDGEGRPRLDTPSGATTLEVRASVLALGGASWPRLGSDGAWQSVLRDQGVRVSPLRAANVGVEMGWSAVFADRFAGSPVKNLVGRVEGSTDPVTSGEAMVTRHGLEGGLVYALGPAIRTALESGDTARLVLDLRSGLALDELVERLGRRRPGDTATRHLERRGGLSAAQIGLLREAGPLPTDATDLAARIKALPLTVRALRPIAEAISSAGGVALDELDARLMLKRLPGVFACGEMLDWEAPTGGWLLQGCFSTGFAAGKGALAWLDDTGR